MAPSDYTSVGSGKLKLKGVKDSKVEKDKKKKKKKPKTKDGDAEPETAEGDDFNDRSVMLKKLADEDARIISDEAGKDHEDDKLVQSSETSREHALGKTEAEKRYEEQRRRRLEERLKREGVKTHKERVEELNRYLSGLSEHHDMPKIGPG